MTEQKIIHTNVSKALDDELGGSTLNFKLKDKAGDTFIEQKTYPGTSQENAQMKAVGERLAPEGYEYHGSAAVHIYLKKHLDGSYEGKFVCQQLLEGCGEQTVSWALKTLSIAIARRFGWQPKKENSSIIK